METETLASEYAWTVALDEDVCLVDELDPSFRLERTDFAYSRRLLVAIDAEASVGQAKSRRSSANTPADHADAQSVGQRR